MERQSLSEAHVGPFNNTYDWWWQYLREGLELNPQGVAIVCPHQPATHLQELVEPTTVDSNGCLSWTYEQLDLASDKVANALYCKGVREGFGVSTFIQLSVEWVIIMWATARLRAIFVPQDPLILGRPSDMEDLMQAIPLRVVLIDTFEDAIHVGRGPFVHLVMTPCKESKKHGFFDLPGLVHDVMISSDSQKPYAMSDEQYDSFDEHDTAAIQFTSGTTSRPKGCVHTTRTVVSGCERIIAVRHLTKESRALVFTASFRAIAFCVSIASWKVGATVVFCPPPFDAEVYLRTIKDHNVTVSALLPTAFHAIVNHPKWDSLRPERLEMCTIGGDIVTAKLRDDIEKAFRCKVVNNAGMTEAWGLFLPLSDRAAPPLNGILSVGRAVWGGARICEPGSRKPIPTGTVGELHVSSPSVIDMYLQKRDSHCFYNDGSGKWFITGDQAMMNENKAIYILGRYKDIIKHGGVCLSPAILENCINGIEGVRAQVIGVPDKLYGEAPLAIIELVGDANVSKAQIEEKALKELGADYRLADVLFLKDLGLDAFPLNATGKVLKTKLREVVNSHRGGFAAPYWI
ncbi:MAG: hypothetical protein M1828_007603 [Chrysothrix sp. TS-e1954]|nr:MAG: hypothetical protein M1828_007603 [Chrysothrix sp. TS-e1954]